MIQYSIYLQGKLYLQSKQGMGGLVLQDGLYEKSTARIILDNSSRVILFHHFFSPSTKIDIVFTEDNAVLRSFRYTSIGLNSYNSVHTNILGSTVAVEGVYEDDERCFLGAYISDINEIEGFKVKSEIVGELGVLVYGSGFNFIQSIRDEVRKRLGKSVLVLSDLNKKTIEILDVSKDREPVMYVVSSEIDVSREKRKKKNIVPMSMEFISGVSGKYTKYSFVGNSFKELEDVPLEFCTTPQYSKLKESVRYLHWSSGEYLQDINSRGFEFLRFVCVFDPTLTIGSSVGVSVYAGDYREEGSEKREYVYKETEFYSGLWYIVNIVHNLKKNSFISLVTLTRLAKSKGKGVKESWKKYWEAVVS